MEPEHSTDDYMLCMQEVAWVQSLELLEETSKQQDVKSPRVSVDVLQQTKKVLQHSELYISTSFLILTS